MRVFSLFLLLGTLFIQCMDYLPSWQWFIVPVLLCACVFLVFRKRTKTIFEYLFLAGTAFSLGLMLSTFQASQIIKQRIPSILEGQELIIQGVVKGIPSYRNDGIRFLLDIDSAEMLEIDAIKASLDLKGIVRLAWFKPAHKIHSGERWQLTVKLKRPSGFMNPAGFDYEKWLFTQRVIATGYVRDSKSNAALKNLKLKDDQGFRSIDYWRQSIHSFIQDNVENKPSAAVLSALLVAVRDNLDDQQWQLLQATGTSHLIAISGLHIAVVAGFAFFPMLLLWRLFPRLNEKIPLRIGAASLGTLFAIAYALLAGFTLPTQRALMMVIIGLWGLVSKRHLDATMILSFALILVLCWDPLAAMSVSFWLSFLAVFLILIFIKRQKEKPRWMVVKLQLFLSFAMLPLTLLFFGTASLVSPIANLLAIPWVSFIIVPISLLALIIMPISTFLAAKLLALSALAIELLFKGLEFVSASLLSNISLPEVPAILLIIALIGFLMLFLPRGFPARGLGLFLIFPALIFEGEKLKNHDFTYTLLDVGQGYASVIQTKNHTLIYDTGIRMSATFDMGKIVIAPYLKSKGIHKIDTLMISHEDIDHRGGAKYLTQHFEIEEIISSDNSDFTQSKLCQSGQSWQWDDVRFEILSPAADFVGSDNDRSCVLKVWNKQHSLLLTGDIQKQTEKTLIALYPEKLRSDVMGVPHHGSKTSSSPEFLDKVSPKIGLISAGYRSRFGHPKPTVTKRYKDAGIELLDTVNYGAIKLSFAEDNHKIHREYYRIESKGVWSR